MLVKNIGTVFSFFLYILIHTTAINAVKQFFFTSLYFSTPLGYFIFFHTLWIEKSKVKRSVQ